MSALEDRRCAARVLPGLRAVAGHHAALPVPDRADPAGARVRSRPRTLRWARVLGDGHDAARARRPTELTFGASLVGGAGQRGVRAAGRLGAGALPLSRAGALVDALVDLPFALPTAVAGIALTTLYAANGWIGGYLEPLGIKVAFTPLGHHGRADLHRPAVRGAHGAAGARGPRRRGRGGRGEPRARAAGRPSRA